MPHGPGWPQIAQRQLAIFVNGLAWSGPIELPGPAVQREDIENAFALRRTAPSRSVPLAAGRLGGPTGCERLGTDAVLAVAALRRWWASSRRSSLPQSQRLPPAEEVSLKKHRDHEISVPPTAVITFVMIMARWCCYHDTNGPSIKSRSRQGWPLAPGVAARARGGRSRQRWRARQRGAQWRARQGGGSRQGAGGGLGWQRGWSGSRAALAPPGYLTSTVRPPSTVRTSTGPTQCSRSTGATSARCAPLPRTSGSDSCRRSITSNRLRLPASSPAAARRRRGGGGVPDRARDRDVGSADA